MDKIVLYAPRGVVGGISSWTEAVLSSNLSDRFEFCLLNYAKFWQDITDPSLHWRTVYESVARFHRLRRLLREQNPKAFYGVAVLGRGLLRDILLARVAVFHGIPAAIHIRSGNWEWLSEMPSTLRPVLSHLARPIQFVTLVDKIPAGAMWFFSRPPLTLPNFLADSKMARAVRTRRSGASGGRRIYYAGWLSESKGAFDVLRVAQALPDCSFVLQGPATISDRNALHKLADQLGLVGRLTILAPADFEAVSVQLRRADIFLMMSHSEGFPNVILEAMAHGLPVVATDVGAISEMLGVTSDQSCGHVVSVGDTVTAARRVSEILSDPELYTAKSRCAQARCLQFYSERIFVDRFSKLIGTLQATWRGSCEGV